MDKDEINELAKKSIYTNPDINYIFNTSIYEYDMKNAGFNISKNLGLLSKSQINKLEKIRSLGNKETATIEFGKMQKKDKDLKEKLSVGFVLFRAEFIEKNELEYSDIISIKKDAFFLNKYVKYTELNKDIQFRIKNQYSSYIYLKPLELYYYDGKIDVKGISDDKLEFHKDYMLKFLIKIFKMAETRDKEDVLRELRKFYDNYKHLKLDIGYYRTFNSDSKFILSDGSKVEVEYFDISELNITYNLNILIKLIKIML